MSFKRSINFTTVNSMTWLGWDIVQSESGLTGALHSLFLSSFLSSFPISPFSSSPFCLLPFPFLHFQNFFTRSARVNSGTYTFQAQLFHLCFFIHYAFLITSSKVEIYIKVKEIMRNTWSQRNIINDEIVTVIQEYIYAELLQLCLYIFFLLLSFGQCQRFN